MLIDGQSTKHVDAVGFQLDFSYCIIVKHTLELFFKLQFLYY